MEISYHAAAATRTTEEATLKHPFLSSLVAMILACIGCGDDDGASGASGSGGTGAIGGSGGSGAIGGSAGSGGSGGTSGVGGSGGTGGTGGGGGDAGTGGAADWWKPIPGTSWQWQLSGNLDTSFDVDAYDIDLTDNSQATIDALHAAGRKVICYFDTAYEPYRDDAVLLEPYRGNPMDGWPGQYWLDIRESAVVDVMFSRLALAASKHCDAVEADDVDSRNNDPGFPITANDQRSFIRSLATEAHRLGLGFGLKNALEDVDALLSDVDFAINEECFDYDECDVLSPFIDAGKAVFHVEYAEGNQAALETKADQVCDGANALNFDTLIKHLDLDAPQVACRTHL